MDNNEINQGLHTELFNYSDEHSVLDYVGNQSFTHLVIDKMIERGFEMRVLYTKDSEWECWFRTSPGSESFTNSGLTMGEAICKAALSTISDNQADAYYYGMPVKIKDPNKEFLESDRLTTQSIDKAIKFGFAYAADAKKVRELLSSRGPEHPSCRSIITSTPNGGDEIYDRFVQEYMCDFTGTEEKVLAKQAGCDHSWKSYQGLTQNYDYCVHCDMKKE